MHNPDINWVTKRIFFYYPECKEYLFFLLNSISVLPSDLSFTVGSLEMPDVTGPPEFIKFLNPLNSLILYFIKNTPLNNPTTLLILPRLSYITLIITKFDKSPA